MHLLDAHSCPQQALSRSQNIPSEATGLIVFISAMRTNLLNRLRRLGTAMMVMAYALGVVTPTVAFAYADHASIVHVLNESHGGMLVVHFHDHDGEGYDHQPGAGAAHHCCGFISLSGLEPPATVAIMPPQTTTALLPPPTRSLSGCGAPPLERPPKLS